MNLQGKFIVRGKRTLFLSLSPYTRRRDICQKYLRRRWPPPPRAPLPTLHSSPCSYICIIATLFSPVRGIRWNSSSTILFKFFNSICSRLAGWVVCLRLRCNETFDVIDKMQNIYENFEHIYKCIQPVIRCTYDVRAIQTMEESRRIAAQMLNDYMNGAR